MFKLLSFKKENAISPLTNPFKKGCVESVSLHITKKSFEEGYRNWGYVEFQNGLTQGKQKFEAETFEQLLTEVKAFLDTLDK